MSFWCRKLDFCLSCFPSTRCIAPFFTFSNRKCLGVAILIRLDDNYVFHRDIQADGRGVAVWFSLAVVPLLAIGLNLPVSGHVDAYEPILQWVLAHVLASSWYLHIVFGDINQNPGWALHFHDCFSCMRHRHSVICKVVGQ